MRPGRYCSRRLSTGVSDFQSAISVAHTDCEFMKVIDELFLVICI